MHLLYATIQGWSINKKISDISGLGTCKRRLVILYDGREDQLEHQMTEHCGNAKYC